MESLSAEGDSVPHIIVTHLQQIQILCDGIAHLYLKSAKQNPSELHNKKCQFEQLLRKCQRQQMDRVICQLQGQLKNETFQFMFYQRTILRQNYNQFFNQLKTKLEKINRKQDTAFYQSRKQQVSFIGQLTSALSYILNKVKQYLKNFNVSCPYQLSQCVSAAITLLKAIKFKPKNIEKDEKYSIKFNFPVKQNKNMIRNSTQKAICQLNCRRSRPGTCKSSKIITNATTRPSSGYHTPRDIRKLPKNWNYSCQPISVYEQQKLNINQRNSAQQKQKSKQKHRTQRPLSIQKYSRNQSQIESMLRNEQSMFKGSKFSLNFNKKINESNNQERQTQNSKMRLSNKKRLKNQKRDMVELLNSTPVNKKIFYQKGVRTQRTARHGLKPQTLQDEVNFQNIRANKLLQLQRFGHKKKYSDIIHNKQNIKNPNIRNNYSHQYSLKINEFSSNAHRFKNGKTYRKKNNKNLHKGIRINQTSIIKEKQEIIYIRRQQEVMLIKVSEEKLKGQSNNKRKFDILAQKIRQSQGEKDENRLKIRRRNKQAVQISNMDQKSVNQYPQTAIQKVQLEQLNKIRQQFVQARWQGNMTANDKQNSVFFIEQGFLTHNQNVKFQKYLKQMRQINGGEQPRQPFKIQCQIAEMNAEKCQQLQRNYTFRIEQQWIKQHITLGRVQIQQQGLEQSQGQEISI